MDSSKIRNFCIIAHIDHGKSTLADRLLQMTGTISEREMQEQVLDSMDLERERGVTIKASAVRMAYTASDGCTYEMNLIDTPGHVDFGYEVSRALQGCEGALLVVDATQGIEAQTLANLYLALESDLEIIPVINKIDLPSSRADEIAQELEDLLGVPKEDMIPVSAKTGMNVQNVLEAIVKRVPPPKGDPNAPLQALIFDSHYDSYKGVIAYVRIVNGTIGHRDPLRMVQTGVIFDPVEIGIFSPTMKAATEMTAGEVGYIATGLKTVQECRVGDTIVMKNDMASPALPGYKHAKPMVFAGFYPVEADDYPELRDSLEKLQLNDASVTFQPETSQALNFGFRVGFLGLFHMDIVQERLEREYNLDILATAPSVEYQVALRNGEEMVIDSPAQLPDESTILEIREPWMKISIFTPDRYIGPIMELVTSKRGKYISTEYLDKVRVLLTYSLPLSELVTDFYDRLKSMTQGYASLDYSFEEYRADALVKMDILVNGAPLDALSMIVHRDHAHTKGQKLVNKLKELIPRQMFPVPIQAALGGKIIARADVKAVRKDVLAKCYGGDISRKKKLLEKQKKGKKRLKMIGNVEVPQDAFMAVLKLDEED
ncbi:MAG: translation elongation factor 4 [Anaerolineae bacterium]|nr:translation elongation factor 4 [Anaerolineae bacterium]